MIQRDFAVVFAAGFDMLGHIQSNEFTGKGSLMNMEGVKRSWG